MKKNKFMRLASALLVLTLLSTCAISGTFAKYTTSDSASDSARVAKWGVVLTAKDDSTSSFKNEYKTTVSGTELLTVKGQSDAKVVAPGTSGEAVTFKIEGTPEVATKVIITINSSEDIFLGSGENAYHPVKWTLARKTGDSTWENVVEKKPFSAIATALNAASNKTYPAGTKLDQEYALSWEWEFGSTANDVNDTALGNLAADKTVSGYTTDGTDYNLDIAYNITFTVEQVD